MNHSEQGFSEEVRKKFCKAYKAECKKCLKTGHFTELFFKGLRIPNDAKKAKVSVVSAETTAPNTAAPAAAETPAAPAGPAAILNSVEQVQEYRFNPDRYHDYDMGSSGWWSVEAVKPIKVQRLWAKMEATSASPALRHLSSTTSVRSGRMPRHRVTRQKENVWRSTGGVTVDMGELKC